MAVQMSKRVNLTLPDTVYADLKLWSEQRDQPLAAVAAICVELALIQAKERGDFKLDPSKSENSHD